MTTHVTETAAAPSELAVKHFQDMLAFETDCWDFPVKMMIGGVTGWIDEGFTLTPS